MTIQETKDLMTLLLNDLLGSLITNDGEDTN